MGALLELTLAWLVYPLVLLAVSWGVGAALVRGTGNAVGTLAAVPLGFAALITLSQLCLLGPGGWVSFTVVVGCTSVFGAWRARSDQRLVPPASLFLTIGVVFAAFALPIVGSGSATFGGYTTLGDTAIQMLGANALGHGESLDTGAATSSAQVALRAYFVDSGYPSGALTALGSTARWSGQDVAWTLQPLLAFSAAMLAAALLALAAELRLPRRWEVAIAVLASQPALLFAYYLQASIKEVVAATLIPLLAVCVGAQLGRPRSEWRTLDVVPLAIVGSALVAVIGLAAAVWVVPAVFLLLVLGWQAFRSDWKLMLRMAVLGGSLVALGSLAAIRSASRYLDVAGTVTTTQAEIGNLVTPLRKISALGVWLAGDFRFQPAGAAWLATQLIMLGVVVFAVLGATYVVRKRAWGSGAFVAISLFGLLTVSSQGSPWADAKAYAIAGPSVLFLAFTGFAGFSLRGRRRYFAAAVLSGLTASGVLVSNVLAARDASLAPRDRLEELGEIARGVDGPILLTEFEEFGKYFLRSFDADIVADTWKGRTPALAPTHAVPPFGSSVPVESLDRRYISRFGAIVLRRSAFTAQPGSAFERVRKGRWYELWARRPNSPSIIGGVAARPGEARIDCGLMRQVLDAATPNATLRGLVEGTTARAQLNTVSPGWRRGADSIRFEPKGGGGGEGVIRVPKRGEYEVWVESSTGTATRVAIGGRVVGAAEGRLNERGGAEFVGTAQLAQGETSWSVSVGNAGLRPGATGPSKWIGGIQLRHVADRPRVITASQNTWRSLCDQPVRWLEAIEPNNAP